VGQLRIDAGRGESTSAPLPALNPADDPDDSAEPGHGEGDANPEPADPAPAEPEPDPEPAEPDPAEPEPDPAEPEPEPEPAESADPACAYPPANERISMNAALPRLSWRGAFGPGGDRVNFDLERFHCDPAYDRYTSLIIFVGAEWCPACHQYLGELAAHVDAIDAAGGLILYVETETNDGQPASHQVAHRTVSRRIDPAAPGIRIGDGETLPNAMAIHNSPIVQGFPTIIVAQRADMRVVARDVHASRLARTVADLSGAPLPEIDCDEEPQEPNDAPAQAALAPQAWVEAGICGADVDFWRIDQPGQWQLQIQHQHAIGDIDVYLWDTANDRPAGEARNPIGSDSSTDDEAFTHTGPATVMVHGYQGDRAPYRLRVRPR
jgi:hypothetical protein